jgi:hypothetical protein
MSRKMTVHYKHLKGAIVEKPTIGILLASGITVPTDATTGYAPGCLFIHEDGTAGNVIYVNEGTKASCAFNSLAASGSDTTLEDEADLGFGAPDVTMRWDTSDANANKFLFQMPAGTGVNVPVVVLGQAIADVDMAIHNGVVSPLVSIIGTGATTTGPVLELRKARGTATAPTVVTAGDDTGIINFYNCVAAGEWVLGAQIRVDAATTQATTRGPASLVIATATDAAPSVLTDALTVDKAQLVTCAAGVTVTTGAVTLTSGSVVVSSGDLTFTLASDVNVAANTAVSLEFDDGTTKVYALDTRTTLKDVSSHTFRAAPATVATEAAVHSNPTVAIAAKTITYTGTATVTSQMGAQLHVGALTLTDADAGTVTKASAVHIVAVAAQGGMLTITASHMITTSVTDCLLTNAGVWTDMACWESGKELVERGVGVARDAVDKAVDKVMGTIIPATWKYKAMTELPAFDSKTGEEYVHRTPIRDRDRERVGIVYDDLPEALRAPGEEKAVSTGVLASFALAALKVLWERNQALEARLERAGL